MLKEEQDRLKKEINARLADYCEAKGHEIRTDNRNFKCILRNTERHPGNDNHPSMRYYENNSRPLLQCFACQAKFDTIDLIAYDNDLTPKGSDFFEILKIGCKVLDIPYPDQNETEGNEEDSPYKDYFSACHMRRNETDYFAKRGLNSDIIEKFSLGYDNHAGQDIKKAIIIPTGPENYTIRNTEEGANRFRRYGNSVFFNISSLRYSDRPVFITEGEFDTLSIEQSGFSSVSLCGASHTKGLEEELSKIGFKSIVVLALDNDEAGRKASAQLAKQLDKAQIPYIRPKIYGDYKDANEMLIANPGLLKTKLAAAETNAKNHLNAIKEAETIKNQYIKELSPNQREEIRKLIADILKGDEK